MNTSLVSKDAVVCASHSGSPDLRMPDFAHGQAVRLELPARSLTWLAVFHYLTVPVLTTLGALLASPGLERAGEGTVMAGGLAGFIVGCAVLRLYDSRAGRYWLSQLEVRRPD